MVEEFERDIDAFTQEETREFYLVGAGLKEELELAPIYERYAHLFTLDGVKQALDQAMAWWEYFMLLFSLLSKGKVLPEAFTRMGSGLRQDLSPASWW